MAAHPLIIVESPTKVKAIKRFLGSYYDVEASGGHVRDLPKSRMGVDLEHDYAPEYISIRGKGDVIRRLKEKAKKANKVYLATDPDREGEAIAWHLEQLLDGLKVPCYRISFNEITQEAVKQALKEPRAVDTALVDAQQARRVLDRVSGYSVSPLLWAKIKRGLSAGRVQSSTLHLLCAKEEEIRTFDPKEYWTVDAVVDVNGSAGALTLSLDTKDVPLENEAATNALLDGLKGQPFVITELDSQMKHFKAPLPFTTSTLQQEASHRLGFSPSRTMRLAQTLYEGVEIKGEGTVGLITYLRTDSTRISAQASAAVRAYIDTTYGSNYVSPEAPAAKNSERAQDAHEAIRPTAVLRTPAAVKDALPRDEYRLYTLIWKRFVASRMADYVYERISLTAKAGESEFRASANVPQFDGFRKVYNLDEETSDSRSILRRLTKDAVLTNPVFDGKQHFTQPPARYTEATLVRTMESCGIGRPSTYAPTISTLQERHYVRKEGRNLVVTELGEAVDQLTVQAVPMLADKDFTAAMEEELDQVAEGGRAWQEILREFYPPFKEKLDQASEQMERVKVQDEVSDVVCEKCGRLMVYKYGPRGRFLACPGFPECRNTQSIEVRANWNCPQCGSPMLILRTRRGKRFYGCSNKDCAYMAWNPPTEAE